VLRSPSETLTATLGQESKPFEPKPILAHTRRRLNNEQTRREPGAWFPGMAECPVLRGPPIAGGKRRPFPRLF
jgi:hypothetical protein